MKKACIILSGYNPRAVIAFLRTLKDENADYAIIASSPTDDIFLTDYKDRIVATRKQKDLDIERILEQVRQAKAKLSADRYVIAPSTEALNRFLIENRVVFEKENCEIPLVSGELYKKISDKQSFGEICKAAGIAVPEEYAELPSKYPFVAKPKQYFAANGQVHTPLLIFDEAQAAKFKNDYDASDFYYQKYIDGDSFYLLYYFYGGGSFAKLSQHNLVQQPEGKSIIAAETSDFHESDESVKYEELFKSLGFSGLVMVEVKKQGPKHYMIEANPRFWGPSQLFVDAGINLFEDFLYDNGLINESPQNRKPKPAKYFWDGGLKKSNGKEVYHNYLPEQFKNDMASWQSCDVYNRKDTKRIYFKEMST